MKKTFTEAVKETLDNNPAMGFITPSEPDNSLQEEPIKKVEAVAGAKPKPTHTAPRATGTEERKSVRVNLLFKPSVKQAVDKLAQFDATSINDLIGKLLEDYVSQRKGDIAKIDALRG